MRSGSRRLLAGPAMLAAMGCVLFVAAPLLIAWFGLAAGSAGAVALHHASGNWMWLALAWLAGRGFDVLLRRVAQISRSGVPILGCSRIY